MIMGKWTKTTAGLIFLAAVSVYADREIAASVRSAAGVTGSARPALVATAMRGSSSPVARVATPQPKPQIIAAAADTTTSVKLLDDSTSTDPFAAPAPAPAPAQTPATQPSTEGRSVSSQEVNVSEAGTVEIHVNDANLVEVLRMLSLQSQRNIIASKDVHGTVTANLYDVTVQQALDAILHANGYVYREKGNFIYVYTAKELQDIEKAERHVQTQVFRLYYTPAANAATMIKPVLSSTGQVAVTTPAVTGLSSNAGSGSSGSSSGGGASGDTGGNSHAVEDMLVVTDYPENLAAVKKVLSEIDVRPQQILLEATILRASLSENNALGINFTVLGGVDFTGLNTAGATAGDLLTGAIVDNPNAQGIVQHNAAGAGTGFANNVPNGGLQVGVVTSNVAAFLKALEQTTDTTVLANPKVLTLNKQQGEVFVGNEDGYYTTITTQTTTSQQVQTLQTGTLLVFRPYIADDGYIRLEVHPEDSDGQVKANGLPSKTTTEVTSNIMVQDGHTVVIGGLFRESSNVGRSQIPFLGNLPLVGALFKSQQDTTQRDEIIILLTPHIVKDQSAYSELSQEQLRTFDQMRVGVRKGMMFWGRNRLAESAYESAKRELAKPHPDRHLAVWDLNEATNLNPTFAEAIELKEQVTGHMVTEASGSSIRDFVQEAVLRDVPPAPAPSTEPAVAPPAKGPAAVRPEAPTTVPVADVPATMPVTGVPATMPTAESTDLHPANPVAVTEPSETTARAATTEPSEQAAETPTTQPAEAIANTEGQSSKSGQEMAESPAMQPTGAVAEESSRNPADEAPIAAVPATNPADTSAVASVPSTQPASGDAETTSIAAEPESVPATQPVAHSDNTESTGTNVTELPMDPATPDVNGGK